MSMFSIEKISAQTRPLIDQQVAEGWSGPYVVSRGVLHDTRTQPGFAALEHDTLLGYVLYNIADGDCEITVLESLRENCGVGGALVREVLRMAGEMQCGRVWLITTNDNTHAIRFYQRIGFALKAVHIDAMDESRRQKPQIPLTGCDDIPLQHEFEFEKML